MTSTDGRPSAGVAYADTFLAESPVITAARGRAAEVGVTAIAPGTGATLRLLGCLVGARAVVEIGTGTGVSALWLLAGMRSDGVLTSVDTEVEHHRLARQAFTEAEIPPARTRLIAGRALDVLPRLTDAGYDLVFVDADPAEYEAYVEQAMRLLRPGGVLALEHLLWHDRVPDPAQRDDVTTRLRELGKSLRADERLVPVLLPVGDGLFAACIRAPG
ncbi:MAG: O-methyltransferase [Actinomycetes bacterium]